MSVLVRTWVHQLVKLTQEGTTVAGETQAKVRVVMGLIAAMAVSGAVGSIGSQALPGQCGQGEDITCGYGLECLQWDESGKTEPEKKQP